ncbi:zinc-dependent alcohol dehydrogenase [Egicoccus halophilus]|uniref:Alcohol dehydrogenase n=1 Tax=Egicoccus halophilus TaxID=1670830 RepID=A0A8J3EW19_9ACTN|nr:zinc-binding dehydrogenase [Egicoccus halophilus]GGI02427.1 alcohol dehydrogenase [Egicoccus halophilus]
MVRPRSTLAAVTQASRHSEVREFTVPDPDDGAIFEIDASGICGADIPKFFGDLPAPVILGHETVGRVIDGDEATIARWGVNSERRYLMEEYVPCGACRPCRIGRYRACAQTNSRDPKALRYGTTSITRSPQLWGGFAQHQYLHPNTVLHEVPEGVPADVATFALPLSNGVQWMTIDAGVRAGESVLIQGPGQQGLACLMAAKAAGCGPIIVSGLAQDRHRLELASVLGADEVLVADEQDVTDAVLKRLPDGVDVVADISGAGTLTMSVALDVVRRGGRVVMAATGAADELPGLKTILAKEVTVRGVRGHGFEAVETALAWLGSGRIDIAPLHEPTYGLQNVAEAFERLQARDAVHLVIEPQKS